MYGELFGQQRLLNGARFLRVAIQCGAFRTFCLKPPRVVNRNRNVIAERLQNSQLLAREMHPAPDATQ